MSKTLNFVEHLLLRARNFREHGQSHAAAKLMTRLIGLRELPADVDEEAHVGLAEFHLEQAEYKQARRHLATAVGHDPECAHYHYLLAVAVEDDPDGDLERAAIHYRRCLALDPENPEYQCDFGRFALHQGNERAGLTALRRAGRLAADNPELLCRIADGLREADRADEAKHLLRAALFRNSRDRRFRELWDRHQFAMVRAAQDAPSQRRQAAEPVLLPFVRPRKRRQSVGAKTVRIDAAERIRGPMILPMHVSRKQDA